MVGPPSAMVTLYGIAGCDTVKRARAWLAEHDVEHAFVDYKKGGVPPARLDAWLAEFGWERLVNRKGTTWRSLDAATRAGVVDAASARALLLAQPSVVKRPIVEWKGGVVSVGFEPDRWPPTSGGAAPDEG